MARLTPHALSSMDAPALTRRPSYGDNRSEATKRADRINRMRKDIAWADRTSESYVRSTMAGRHGVRL